MPVCVTCTSAVLGVQWFHSLCWFSAHRKPTRPRDGQRLGLAARRASGGASCAARGRAATAHRA
eukprot:1922409-Prymnesium_polylepis.2